MNRIKQFTNGFSIYNNTQDIKDSHDTRHDTQDIKESHDTMRHDLLGCFNKFLS